MPHVSQNCCQIFGHRGFNIKFATFQVTQHDPAAMEKHPRTPIEVPGAFGAVRHISNEWAADAGQMRPDLVPAACVRPHKKQGEHMPPARFKIYCRPTWMHRVRCNYSVGGVRLFACGRGDDSVSIPSHVHHL